MTSLSFLRTSHHSIYNSKHQNRSLQFSQSLLRFSDILRLQFFSKIVVATNSYADNARKDEEPLPHARPWISVNSTDIWRFIGYLLHMGYHKLSNHEDHWSRSGHLRKFMTFWMFAQSIATCFGREIKWIKANKANDFFESP
jgi:Transposase IS4